MKIINENVDNGGILFGFEFEIGPDGKSLRTDVIVRHDISPELMATILRQLAFNLSNSTEKQNDQS